MEKVEAVDVLNELIASKKVIETSMGPMWFEYPTLADRIYAKFLYNKKFDSCLKEGVLTIEESIAFHRQHNEWNDHKEELVKKYPEYISETTEKIKLEKNRIRKKKFEEWCHKLQTEYMVLLDLRSQMLCNSAEFLANDHAATYLVWRCFKGIDGKSIWPTYESALNDENARKISELVSLFTSFSKDVESSVLREIARMPLWRVRWNACGGDMNMLFGRTAQDLTNDQFMLVYWSQLYDNVYESLDRPPDEIISDDDKLDEWLKRMSDERSREIAQKFYAKSSASKKGNAKIENASEVLRVVQGTWNEKGEFIPFSEEERWKEVERIRNLNSPLSRSIKKKEEEKLKKAPGTFVQEHELRRKDEDRQAMGGKISYIRKGVK